MTVLRSPPMSYLVLVVLSLLWLGFFLPSLLQSRRASSPFASAETFQQSLTRISTGQAVTADGADETSRRRRRSRREIARQRETLMVLGAAVVGSVVLAVAFGGAARALAALTILGFVGYVALLRAQVVRDSLPQRRPQPRRAPARPETPAAGAAEPAVIPSVRRRSVPDDDRVFERIAG